MEILCGFDCRVGIPFYSSVGLNPDQFDLQISGCQYISVKLSKEIAELYAARELFRAFILKVSTLSSASMTSKKFEILSEASLQV